MNLHELLAELSDRGVQLWLDGDQLGLRAPKGVLTPELRQILAQQKESLINLLRQRSHNRLVAEQPLGTIPRTEFLPLTFEQERLLNISRLVPQNAAHNLTHLIQLTGQLDVNILQKSIQAIALRHEALRTIFVLIDDKPVQKVLPVSSIELSQLNWQTLTPEQQKSAIEELGDQEAKYSFEIIGEKPWRCQLAQLSQTNYILSLTFHHLITDLLSVALFIEELVAHYQAILNDTSPAVPELPIQYGDFALWQQQLLEGEFLQSQIENWKSELAGNPPLVELPSDRPRLLMRSFQGDHEPFKLEKKVWDGLKHLSQQEGCTPFITLLAAFKVLLHRYSGQIDIRIGSPTSGRMQRQLEPLIGFLAYPLVLRTDLSGNPSFKDILERVKAVVVKAQAQQKIPFGKILEFMPPELRQQQNPFAVLFSFVNKQIESSVLGNLTITPMTEMTQGMRDLDLLVSIYGVEEGLSGGFEYNTDLFEATTIRRMIGHFQTLLAGIVANPDQCIGKLPLLTPTERHLIEVEWNNTQRDYPQDRCLHQLFEEQAAKTPEAIAVVFKDQSLTYEQLNQKANQLAHYLQKLGVKPEVLVGISMERSLEMVIGLLGILKAGGAYVPIDPTYPEERLLYLLTDSQISILLTQARLVEELPDFSGKLLCLDQDWQNIASEIPENPVHNTQPDNLAYVIYTSGSTGKPKGAMNTHQGIVNRLLWMQEAYQLTPEDRIIQKTPFSFDVSVWEFFWPLITGARLVIAQPEGHKDSGYLVKLIEQEQITTVHFVPSMLQVFLEEPGVVRCQSLKRVICSGEALPRDLVKRFFTRLECKLHNLYGPTEAAIDVTAWHCQPDNHSPVVPIGKAISNTQLYILDPYGQSVPIGIKGELHIGGIQVARGYLNRPELTAEKFIANPFIPLNKGGMGGLKLYKTGDVARYLPDGNIEYLGRIDHQVKIRGFRIELGEIESILTQSPLVREAVVIVWGDKSKVQHLVAYFVPNQQQEIDSQELREFLQNQLPDYMVPSKFVQLETMPLNPNGKVDRRALPLPNFQPQERSVKFVPPQTATEKTIADIASGVLNVKEIGIYDNFFELGGNSLLATQILARLRQTFTVELPLYRLFESPTINGLAQAIDQLKEQPSQSKPPSIVRVSREARRMKRP